MQYTFDVQYLCNGCGERHSTYVQYSRELADSPNAWDLYDEGREHSEVKSLIGKTFDCEKFPDRTTTIQSVDVLFVWPIS